MGLGDAIVRHHAKIAKVRLLSMAPSLRCNFLFCRQLCIWHCLLPVAVPSSSHNLLAQVNKAAMCAALQVVLPASIAFGFMYTMQTGRSPLTDAKTAATGQEGMQYSIRVSNPSSSS